MHRKKTFNTFIIQANNIHNNKYNYFKYINDRTKIPISCPKHGIFYQTPSSHLQNHGCPQCGIESQIKHLKHDLETFILKANKTHNNKYIYDKININNKKVLIGCPKHGYFLQKKSSHLYGQGCPKCASTSSFGEKTIKNFLISKSIYFIEQYRFSDCKGIKNTLPFDFYLPKYNTCIEYDGKQHFMPIKIFGNKDAFNKIKINDNHKNQYCQNKNITLIRINYKQKNNINNILSSYFTLLMKQ